MRLPYLIPHARIERPSSESELSAEQSAKLDALVIACLSEHYKSGATAGDIGMDISRPARQVQRALVRLQHEGRVRVITGEKMTPLYCIPTHTAATVERVEREEIEESLELLNFGRRRVT